MARPAIDMTGKQIFMLTVLKKDENIPPGKGAWWICQCECGTIKSIRGTDLRTGRVKSCGCYNKQLNRELHLENLLNQKFGYLTVIKNLDKINNSRRNMWLCQCKCGNIVEIASGSLKSGNTQSCGCIKSKGEEKIAKILRENNISFIKEKRFDSCKDKNSLPFDFYVNNQYLIEFDGRQHFTENSLFDFQITKKHDKIKNQWCFKNNIPLIRIPYTHLKDLCIEDLLLNTSKYLIKEEINI